MREDKNQNEQNSNLRNTASEDSQAASDPTPIYVTGDITLQTPAEHQHDQSIDPTKDTTIAASKDDLHETNADRLAGSDRAGTSERKDNNMSESQ